MSIFENYRQVRLFQYSSGLYSADCSLKNRTSKTPADQNQANLRRNECESPHRLRLAGHLRSKQARRRSSRIVPQNQIERGSKAHRLRPIQITDGLGGNRQSRRSPSRRSRLRRFECRNRNLPRSSLSRFIDERSSKLRPCMRSSARRVTTLSKIHSTRNRLVRSTSLFPRCLKSPTS